MVSCSTNEPTGRGPLGSGEIPLFAQIATRIADDIIDATLAEGDQAPSTNEIAAFWGINPATALKGINQLVADGVLFKQRGIGMFVADGARDSLRRRRTADFAEHFVRPMTTEARRLGLSVSDVTELMNQEASR